MDRYRVSQTKNPPKGESPDRRLPKERMVIVANRWPLIAAAAAIGIVLIGSVVLIALHIHSSNLKVATGSDTASKATTTNNTNSSSKVPTATKAAVISAVELKQPTTLNSRFASSVHVVIAGKSDQIVNASQAAAYLASLNSATNPWDWNIPVDQLANWQNGPDGQYFTGNDVVGESANGYVVSFGTDSSGQIDSIFVTDDASSLSDDTGSSSNSNNSTDSSGQTDQTDQSGSDGSQQPVPTQPIPQTTPQSTSE